MWSEIFACHAVHQLLGAARMRDPGKQLRCLAASFRQRPCPRACFPVGSRLHRSACIPRRSDGRVVAVPASDSRVAIRRERYTDALLILKRRRSPIAGSRPARSDVPGARRHPDTRRSVLCSFLGLESKTSRSRTVGLHLSEVRFQARYACTAGETRNRYEMVRRWLDALKGRRHIRLVAVQGERLPPDG